MSLNLKNKIPLCAKNHGEKNLHCWLLKYKYFQNLVRGYQKETGFCLLQEKHNVAATKQLSDLVFCVQNQENLRGNYFQNHQ